MFGELTKKFQGLFTTIRGQKNLSEKNIAESVSQVRLALLDADCNFKVVSSFVKRVKAQAIGKVSVKGIMPSEKFVELVHESLIEFMGVQETPFQFKANPFCVMLCGLQGSGKTTQAAKLAYFLKQKDYEKKPLLVALDLARPAAIEQLKVLASSIDVPVFSCDKTKCPVKIAAKALDYARNQDCDVIIFDTAGRLHIDDTLMKELESIKKLVKPHETLFVANSQHGQDAVNTAREFDSRIAITGSILTMLDGTSRAGAAISIREVTGKPLKFEGVGERVEDLRLFNPKSMADRILGMGDVINLVKKIEGAVDEEQRSNLEKKLKKGSFTYDDFLKQMSAVKKMGSLGSIMKMIPGMSDQLEGLEESEGEFTRIEAIILSMTLSERVDEVQLLTPRRSRIAKGAGVKIDEVHGLVKKFKQMKKMSKNMSGFKKMLGKNGDMKEAMQNFLSK
jgi:signal recognition particle subunit SRP54